MHLSSWCTRMTPEAINTWATRCLGPFPTCALVLCRIGDETGTPLDEVGVIAVHANVLMHAKIPILYLGGTSDSIMVPERNLDRAIEAFESRGFTVRHAAANADVPTHAEVATHDEWDTSDGSPMFVRRPSCCWHVAVCKWVLHRPVAVA